MKIPPFPEPRDTSPCRRRDCTRVLAAALAAMLLPRAHSFATAADARAAKLTADIGTFTLRLNYMGQEDKPFYRLLLNVPALAGKKRDNPFSPQAQITAAQAASIVEFLSKEGFFDTALDGNRNLGPVPPKEPYYALTVGVANGGNPILFEEWLTFRPLLFQRLDGLQKLLDGDAAKGLEFLIGRLSGYRKLSDLK